MIGLIIWMVVFIVSITLVLYQLFFGDGEKPRTKIGAIIYRLLSRNRSFMYLENKYNALLYCIMASISFYAIIYFIVSILIRRNR
jgi:hypothetical protein